MKREKIWSLKKKLKIIENNEIKNLLNKCFINTIECRTMHENENSIYFDKLKKWEDEKIFDINISFNYEKFDSDFKNKSLKLGAPNIIREYVRIVPEKSFELFLQDYVIFSLLYKNSYIDSERYVFIRSWMYGKIKENKYNKFALENENSFSWGYKTFNELLSKTPNSIFPATHSSSDSFIRELLFKGDHNIRVKFAVFNVEETAKGYEFKNTSWWRNNWNWMLTVLSVILSITIPLIIRFA